MEQINIGDFLEMTAKSFEEKVFYKRLELERVCLKQVWCKKDSRKKIIRS